VTTADFMFSDLVPAPRHLTLERQLNKSVLIGWNPTDQYGNHQIESYHVYVDGNLKVTVKAAERTRALVEGVDCNRVCLDQRPSINVINYNFTSIHSLIE
jgi:RIMS-binding protein 2